MKDKKDKSNEKFFIEFLSNFLNFYKGLFKMNKNIIFLIICFLFSCSQNNNFNGHWIIEDEESTGKDVIEQILNQKDIILKEDPTAEQGFEFFAAMIAGMTVDEFKDIKINDNKFLLGGQKDTNEDKNELKIELNKKPTTCEIGANSNSALCDDERELDLRISADNLLVTIRPKQIGLKIKLSLKRVDSKISANQKQPTDQILKNDEKTMEESVKTVFDDAIFVCETDDLVTIIYNQEKGKLFDAKVWKKPFTGIEEPIKYLTGKSHEQVAGSNYYKFSGSSESGEVEISDQWLNNTGTPPAGAEKAVGDIWIRDNGELVGHKYCIGK